MGAFWLEVLHYLPAVIGCIATVVVTIMSVRNKSKGVDVNDVVNNVVRMLPDLINLTEVTNVNKTGAEKKAFLMNYIKGLISITGASLDEKATEFISTEIDSIIALTKAMHTERGENEIEKNF